MAQSPLWGTDASSPVGTFVPAVHANMFSLSFALGITSYFGFSDYWGKNHGTLNSWSGSIAGFTTSGVTGNSIVTLLDSGANTGTNAARSGESWTFTWKTGCTITGTIIFTGSDNSVNFLGTDTTALSFVGTDAPNYATWAVT